VVKPVGQISIYEVTITVVMVASLELEEVYPDAAEETPALGVIEGFI